MITIYHNPRCSKSREALALLEEKNADFKIVKYLDTPFSEQELKDLLQKLNIKPLDLVRKNEVLWKENYKDKKLSEEELISILVKHPILIERPIVVNGNKACISRPAEKILGIL